MLSDFRRLRGLTLAIVSVLILGTVTAAFAQNGSDPKPQPKPKKLNVSDGTFADLTRPEGASGKVTLLVEFEGKPAAAAYGEQINAGTGAAAANGAAAAAVTLNNKQQAAAKAGLDSLGATTLYSVQRVLNATVIRVDASKVRDVMNLPGVVRVSKAPRHTIDNSQSVPFIGANTVWDSTGALSTHGLVGAGMTIAVIDTGVDYIHKNFGGGGVYTGQDSTVIGTDGYAFPTTKVIDGYDFVGDDYDANSDNPLINTPAPDPDPIDCNGHGSHTAGTSGGTGVAGGNTYAGGYDNLTDFSGFEVGPGVAPAASIVAYKVFGCDGSTDVVIEAIEKATDPNGDMDLSDHYDVINMSLGSDYGFTGEEAAIANAVNAGVIVVASAGNAGDNHYIAGSPANVTEAISVAASIGGGQSSWLFNWDNAGNGSIDKKFFAIPQGWAPVPGATTPLTALQKPSGNSNGCAPGDFDGANSGKVAYIFRGTCSIKLKAYNAQLAGATAAVIVAHNTNVPVAAADDATVPAVTIPTVMISGDAGDIIEAGTFAGDKGSISPTGGTSLAEQIAGFSSRGPRRENLEGTLLLKPDISAPGFNIVSTANGSVSGVGDQGVAESGTSMAAPHIAGVMALLREEHPTWTVAELKALVMNTALHDIYDTNLITGAKEDKVSSARMGAGRVDVPLAANGNVIAFDTAAPSAVSVTFQTRDVLEGTTETESRTITVSNKGATPVTYSVSVVALEKIAGIKLKATPNKITVAAGGTGVITLTATYTASKLLHTLDPGSLEDQAGNPRHWITEVTGYVQLKSSLSNLRVPYYAAPRPASAMTEDVVAGTEFVTGPAGSVSIPLVGTDVDNHTNKATLHSGYGQNYLSQVSAFELGESSPEVDANPNPWDGGDIQYVGVANDAYIGGDGFSLFGVSTYGDWDTPSVRQVYVCLDLNQDGTGGPVDFKPGTDWCYITVIDDETDSQMTGLWDVNGFLGGGPGLLLTGWDFQNQVSAFYDTRGFDNSVFFMPAETDPGLYAFYATHGLPGANSVTGGGTDTNPAFDYYIYTADLNDPVALAGGTTDTTAMLHYDPVTAPIHHTTFDVTAFGAGAPIRTDLDGETFNFDYDFTGDGDGKVDLLFLHHYNMGGDRAQIVTIDSNAPPCAGLLNCDFEKADNKNRPLDWKGTALKAGDVLTDSPTAHGSKSWQFSGKNGTRTLYQDVVRSGSSGDPISLTFYVDGTGLVTGDASTVTLTFYNGSHKTDAAAFVVLNTMDMTSQQTYNVNAPTNFTKIRVTLSGTLKTTASKVVFDLLSLP